MAKRYVIVGGDAAGMSAASQIRRQDPEGEIIVFEKKELFPMPNVDFLIL